MSGGLSALGIFLASRYCGPGVFSKFSIILALLGVTADLLDFGSCSQVTRDLAAKRIQGKHFLEALLSKVFLVCVIGSLFEIFFLFVRIKSMPFLAFIFLYPVLWLMTNYVQGFLLVHEKYLLSVMLMIAERSSWLLIIFMKKLNFSSEESFVYPILIGLFFHVTIGCILISSSISKVNLNVFSGTIARFRKSRNFGIPSLLTDLSILDVSLVSFFIGVVSSASYVLGQRFRNPLSLGFMIFALRLRNSLAVGDYQEFRQVVKEEFHLVILNIVGVCFFALLVFFQGSKLFVSEYRNVNTVVSICFLNSIFVGCSYVFVSILNSTGNEKVVSIFYSIGIPCQLTLIAFGAFIYSVQGAAIFLLFSNLVFSICLSILCRPYLMKSLSRPSI